MVDPGGGNREASAKLAVEAFAGGNLAVVRGGGWAGLLGTKPINPRTEGQGLNIGQL